MYQLIFFDDDEVQLEWISEIVLNYCKEKMGGQYNAILCTAEEKLWEALEWHHEENPVLFMDIYLEQQTSTGIEITSRINRAYPGLPVVFLTGYVCYVSDVYETEHCYFLLKEEMEQKLPTLFEKILPSLYSEQYKWLNLHIGFKVRRVQQRHILYLERELRKTKVFLVNGECLETTEKLNILQEQLDPEGFVRCHNSYIVHLKYVKELERTLVTMENGSILNVSKLYGQEMRRRFIAWENRKF